MSDMSQKKEKRLLQNNSAIIKSIVSSTMAKEIAKEYNLNLICRAWRDSYQVFNEAKY